MKHWTEADAAKAYAEGWMFVSRYRLRAIAGLVASFTEVRDRIVQGVLEGSPLHVKAMALLYVYNEPEYASIVDRIPPNTGAREIRAVLTVAQVLR